MSERSEYAPGEFCWVDLATTDVEGAKAFYNGLLGVDAQDAPGDPEETGGYGFLMSDGKMVAGIGPVQSDEGHSAWASYVKVDDGREGEGCGRQRLLRTCRPPERLGASRDAAGSGRGVHRHRAAETSPRSADRQ